MTREQWTLSPGISYLKRKHVQRLTILLPGVAKSKSCTFIGAEGFSL